MIRKILRFFSLILLMIGVLIFLYPHGKTLMEKKNQKAVIKEFIENASQNENYSEDYTQTPAYQNMVAYNEKIYNENQAGMTDAWDDLDDSIPVNSDSLQDRLLGYISIAAMNVTIPLYAGADAESLYYGAGVLAETSMPIGGINTNCVIAAHRGGYEGTAMFRDIEKIKPGDIVEVTNQWQTLQYEAVKMIVISPDDLQVIKIIPEEDLLTLITCHPYGGNKQRYVVYCRRVGTDMPSENIDEIIPYNGEPYSSSEEEIAAENNLNKTVGVLILMILIGISAAAVKKIINRVSGK